MGVSFLRCGALFALLMAGGSAGGKAAAGSVILVRRLEQEAGVLE